MKIVCDDKIPYIREALCALADEVVMKPGRDIGPDDVRDADILVVRTRTRCDERLLSGSRVRLVLTATIGFDHLDTRWMEAHGIRWANCPGCNASSVGQYVRSALLQLARRRGLPLGRLTLGIVGVGHVGTAVLEAVTTASGGALRLGRILLCDPPREAAGDVAPQGLGWSSLERLCLEADILTFHTPLTREGRWPTWHLAGESFFDALPQNRSVVVINAARGGVVDEAALLRAMDEGRVGEAVVDTWENEPDINPALLRRAFIGTPHIAGYSADGKANATRMVVQHICRYLGRPMTFDIQAPPLPADFRPIADPAELALQLYDPCTDSSALKAAPAAFEHLRGHYPLRREFV